MVKLLSWAGTMDLVDDYEMTRMLIVYSESEGVPETGSFSVGVYTHVSGAVLYTRADPNDPAAGCLLSPELKTLLPADAELGEPFSEGFVKVLAAGEKRLKKTNK